MDKKPKYEIYFECLKCGDRLPRDTNKKMTPCKCGAIEIDGCEFYTRIIGSKEDWKEIRIEIE
jgi:hypothetical protein